MVSYSRVGINFDIFSGELKPPSGVDLIPLEVARMRAASMETCPWVDGLKTPCISMPKSEKTHDRFSAFPGTVQTIMNMSQVDVYLPVHVVSSRELYLVITRLDIMTTFNFSDPDHALPFETTGFPWNPLHENYRPGPPSCFTGEQAILVEII